MKRLLQLAAVVLSLSVASTAYPAYIPIYCGDPCSPNGDRTGCRCEGFRDICTCINGHWSTMV